MLLPVYLEFGGVYLGVMTDGVKGVCLFGCGRGEMCLCKVSSYLCRLVLFVCTVVRICDGAVLVVMR